MSKFWRRNEKKLMRSMGLKPTFGSGNTWAEKEDGESEFILAQAKSTKSNSISFKKKDILDLFENAAVVDKLPVFVLDFVDRDMPVKLLCFEFNDGLKLLEMGNLDD